LGFLLYSRFRLVLVDRRHGCLKTRISLVRYSQDRDDSLSSPPQSHLSPLDLITTHFVPFRSALSPSSPATFLSTPKISIPVILFSMRLCSSSLKLLGISQSSHDLQGWPYLYGSQIGRVPVSLASRASPVKRQGVGEHSALPTERTARRAPRVYRSSSSSLDSPYRMSSASTTYFMYTCLLRATVCSAMARSPP
jgi:hypothetical protein